MGKSSRDTLYNNIMECFTVDFFFIKLVLGLIEIHIILLTIIFNNILPKNKIATSAHTQIVKHHKS